MECKKKRWRPSLADYRGLQKELESQIEDTSVLVAECDAWREKYRRLRDDHDATVRQFIDLQFRVAELEGRGFWSRLFNRK